MNAVMKFLKDEEGVTAIEYALLAALIALSMAAGAVILGNGLETLFTNIGNELSTATVPAIP